MERADVAARFEAYPARIMVSVHVTLFFSRRRNVLIPASYGFENGIASPLMASLNLKKPSDDIGRNSGLLSEDSNRSLPVISSYVVESQAPVSKSDSGMTLSSGFVRNESIETRWF